MPERCDLLQLATTYHAQLPLRVRSYLNRRGIPDVVIDFKTAGSAYTDHEVLLNDQLTAYKLVRPEAEQSALCVFVKTKEPRIEWYFALRHPQDLAEYLAKVEMVALDIAAAHFYRRPGKHCAYCDFLPVCVGDQAKARETLVRIDPH